MKKNLIFLFAFLMAMALASCSLQPEPTPVPAEVPAEEISAEPTTETAETSGEESAAEPAEETVEEPAVDPTEAPAEESSAPEAGAEDSTEENPDSAAYQALAAQTADTVTAVIFSECPPGSTVFPIPDPDSDAKRPLDFTPFAEVMNGFTAEQAVAMDAALAGKTLPEIQELLNNGDFTSERLLLYYLDRIQRYDVNKLNSVMELNPDALAIAQELDAERVGEGARGNLHGIPVLLKDNIATGDQMHTTAGNYALKDWQPDRDAFLVQQLRDAGAIIMGKANLSEWANYTDPCIPSGFTSIGGQVRHAYGPYDPYGSSTGSAVSVAANLTPVSVGSETSGSITAPARTNGVVALRPSQGLVSGDHIIPLESHLDTAGPMGHSVTDIAILLTAMAGTDGNDPKTADAVALADTDFTQYLSVEEAQKLKVGVVQFDFTGLTTFLQSGGSITEEEIDALTEEEWQELSDTLVAPANGAANQAIIDALENQGIEVVVIKESTLPMLVPNGEAGLLNYGFQNSVNAFLASLGDAAPLSSLQEAVDIVNEDPANRAPYGQRYVEWSAATETTTEEYEAALRGGLENSVQWIEWFKDTHDVDVVMAGRSYQSAGLANIPALTIPTVRMPDAEGQPGEPTGVILTGRYLSDAQVIAVAYALEQALNVQIEPDLETTIQQIEVVTGQ